MGNKHFLAALEFGGASVTSSGKCVMFGSVCARAFHWQREHHPPELFFHPLWTSDEPSTSVLLALVLGWGLHGKMLTQRC